MKTNQILILVGVLLLVIIIVNWSKITEKKLFRYGGDVHVIRNGYGIISEQFYCCKELNPWGSCLVWETRDYPCDREPTKQNINQTI